MQQLGSCEITLLQFVPIRFTDEIWFVCVYINLRRLLASAPQLHTHLGTDLSYRIFLRLKIIYV